VREARREAGASASILRAPFKPIASTTRTNSTFTLSFATQICSICNCRSGFNETGTRSNHRGGRATRISESESGNAVSCDGEGQSSDVSPNPAARSDSGLHARDVLNELGHNHMLLSAKAITCSFSVFLEGADLRLYRKNGTRQLARDSAKFSPRGKNPPRGETFHFFS
jgi:hypothetical protein